MVAIVITAMVYGHGPLPVPSRPLQVDSEDEEGGDGGSDDVDSDDELLAGLDADPEVRIFWGISPGFGG